MLPGRAAGTIIGQSDYARLTVSSNRKIQLEILDPDNPVDLEDPDPAPSQSTQSREDCLAAPVEEWTFFVGTVAFDGVDSTVRLYRNGAEVSSSPVVVAGASLINPGTTEMIIGGDPNDSCAQNNTNVQAYGGRIDDVRVYDRALVPGEVVALFNEVNNP